MFQREQVSKVLNSLYKNNYGKNITLLWFGSLISAGFAFIIQLILARGLNPNDYGNFMASFVTITSLVPLVGFGIHSFWLKAFGKNGWYGMIWVQSSFRFLFLTSFLTITLIILWAIFGDHSNQSMYTLILLIPFLLGQTIMELLGAKFQLEEKYLKLALIQVLPNFARLTFLIFIIILISESFSIIWVASLYSFVSIGTIIYGFVELKRMKHGHFQLIGHDDSLKSQAISYIANKKIKLKTIINGSWPFGLASLFHLIYFQSDIILIKYMLGDVSAGFYSVSVTIITATLLLPSVIYQKYFLSKFHRWSNYNKDLFYKVFRRGNIFMIMIGLIIMILIMVFSSNIVNLLFGIEYQSSVILLQILSVNIPIMFVASSVGATLVTQKHMKTKVKIMGGVAGMNVLINILLLPLIGVIGAAFSTLFCNFVLLVLYYIVSIKQVFEKKHNEY